MMTSNPSYDIVVLRHPAHSTLTAFPIACFTLTLVTDILYWRTGELMWQHFSEWLLLAGLVFGALALIAGVLDLLLRPVLRDRWPVGPYALGSVLVLILAIFNSLVHAADGWTGVVPYGLVLSAIIVLVMLVTGWFGRPTYAERHWGVRP